MVNRGRVEDTKLEAKAKNSPLRTDPFEAKDRNAQGPRTQAQVFSKKKGLQNFFLGDLQNIKRVCTLHRAKQHCFELLALIGSPQLSFSKVFPAEQTSWPNWQTLWACTEADA